MEKPRQGRPLAVGPQRWEPGRVAAAPDSPQPVHLVQAQGLTHLQRGTLRVDGTMSILPALLCLSQLWGHEVWAARGAGEATPPCLWKIQLQEVPGSLSGLSAGQRRWQEKSVSKHHAPSLLQPLGLRTLPPLTVYFLSLPRLPSFSAL